LAEKRDVLQPLYLNIDWEQSLQNNYPNKMIVRDDMKMAVAEAILKLSMDDLFIFKSISEKQSKDLQTLI
jgi:hypothetical protein